MTRWFIRLAALVGSSALAASTAPVLGPAGLVTVATHRSNAGQPEAPSIASDGTDFLVVWADSRAETESHIFGTRVTAAGVIEDTLGLPICVVPGGQSNPLVTYDGADYLVAWQDNRSSQPGVYLTRVDSTGNVLDTTNFLAAAGTGATPEAFVSGSEVSVLVVQQLGSSGAPELNSYTITASSSGLTVGTPTLLTSRPGIQPNWSVVAATGASGFLVAWPDVRIGSTPAIYDSAVSEAGVVVTTQGQDASISWLTPGLTGLDFDSSTGDYVATWWDNATYAARLNSSGNPVDSTPVQILSGSNKYPSIAFDPHDGYHLGVWQSASASPVQVEVERFSSSLNPMDKGPTILGNGETEPAAPAAGGAVVGVNQAGTFLIARLADLSPSAISDSVVVTTFSEAVTATSATLTDAGVANITTATQYSPAVAYSGTEYFAAWDEVDDEPAAPGPQLNIHGSRLGKAGAPLDDDAGLALSEKGGSFYASLSPPAVASDGTGFLVAWAGSTDAGGRGSIEGIFLATDAGAVTGVVPLARSTSVPTGPAPALAAGDGLYMTSWSDGTQIFLSRISPAGKLLDSADIPSIQLGINPSLGFGAGRFMLAFQHSAAADIDVAALNADGGVAGVNLISEDTGVVMSTPAVAAGDGKFLVAWEEAPDAGTPGNVVGVFVSSTGTPLDVPNEIVISLGNGTPLGSLSTPSRPPGVVFDGTAFVVTWAAIADGGPQWMATRVLPSDGGTLETTPIDISAPTTAQRTLGLASTTDGGSMMVYSVLKSLSSTERVQLRTLDEQGGSTKSSSSSGKSTGKSGSTRGTSGKSSTGATSNTSNTSGATSSVSTSGTSSISTTSTGSSGSTGGSFSAGSLGSGSTGSGTLTSSTGRSGSTGSATSGSRTSSTSGFGSTTSSNTPPAPKYSGIGCQSADPSGWLAVIPLALAAWRRRRR